MMQGEITRIAMAEGTFFAKNFHLYFKKETTEVLHSERSFVWRLNLDIAESRLEISGEVLNLLLGKAGEVELDRSFEK